MFHKLSSDNPRLLPFPAACDQSDAAYSSMARASKCATTWAKSAEANGFHCPGLVNQSCAKSSTRESFETSAIAFTDDRIIKSIPERWTASQRKTQ